MKSLPLGDLYSGEGDRQVSALYWGRSSGRESWGRRQKLLNPNAASGGGVVVRGGFPEEASFELGSEGTEE